jgi:glycine cleavage system aminomethyltransferase T
MDPPNDRWFNGPERYHADQVLNAKGERVGVSSGRCYSYYFREMLSLCTISKEYAQIGTSLILLWGDPNTRQKKIRVTVEQFPYLDQGRNEVIGTDHIPSFKPKK